LVPRNRQHQDHGGDAQRNGDDERRQQHQDVRGVIRGDVDHDAGSHDTTRHAAPLERPGHHHGAADARRRKRLVQKQLRETELGEPHAWKRQPRESGRSSEHFSLRDVGSSLKEDRQEQPAGTRPLDHPSEFTRLGQTEGNRDDNHE
jgi:hypothetical protein